MTLPKSTNVSIVPWVMIPSLKLTAKAPEKGWLEYLFRFLLGRLGLFSGAFAVSFRECNTSVDDNTTVILLCGAELRPSPVEVGS